MKFYTILTPSPSPSLSLSVSLLSLSHFTLLPIKYHKFLAFFLTYPLRLPVYHIYSFILIGFCSLIYIHIRQPHSRTLSVKHTCITDATSLLCSPWFCGFSGIRSLHFRLCPLVRLSWKCECFHVYVCVCVSTQCKLAWIASFTSVVSDYRALSCGYVCVCGGKWLLGIW